MRDSGTGYLQGLLAGFEQIKIKINNMGKQLKQTLVVKKGHSPKVV